MLAGVQAGAGALFSVCVLAGIAVALIGRRVALDKWRRRALDRASTRLMGMGFFGLFLLFLSYERISVLSLRAGYLVWIFLAIWYAFRTVRQLSVEIPALEERQRLQKQRNRWLPKKA